MTVENDRLPVENLPRSVENLWKACGIGGENSDER